jgi:hypothetical protein
MNDGKFEESNYHYHTFFKFNNLYYVVSFLKDSKEVGFGVSTENTQDSNLYSDSRITTRNALSVYSHVLYVILDLLKKTNSSEVRFRASDPKLGVVYDTMVKNKFILNHIKKKGFEYSGLFDEFHVFKRI